MGSNRPNKVLNNIGHFLDDLNGIERFHRGRGFSYFSYYGNSILYNERVEIGGYTIQFYHKLEQLFRSYCHKNIGIFVYNPMGGVQLLYTKWITHSFSMGVANFQILITSHYQLQII